MPFGVEHGVEAGAEPRWSSSGRPLESRWRAPGRRLEGCRKASGGPLEDPWRASRKSVRVKPGRLLE